MHDAELMVAQLRNNVSANGSALSTLFDLFEPSPYAMIKLNALMPSVFQPLGVASLVGRPGI